MQDIKGIPFEAPDHFRDEFYSSDEALYVSVDANVVVPTRNVMPVIKIKPAELSQEMADSIINALFGNNQLYYPQTFSDRTKDEIMEEILRLKKGDTDLANNDREAYDAFIAPELERLEKQYSTALDEYVPKQNDGEFEEYVFDSNNIDDINARQMLFGDHIDQISVTGIGLNGEEAFLTIQKNEYNQGIFEFYDVQDGDIEASGTSVFLPINKVNPDSLPEISTEEAQAIASDLVFNMGFSDFLISDIGVGLASTYYFEDADYYDGDKCYVLIYTKDYGFPINYIANKLNRIEYGLPWNYETLKIFVEDTGVRRVIYQSPSDTIDVVSESVELLPFEDIMARFKAQMLIQESYQEEFVKHETFDIEKIQLGLGRILLYAESNEYLYVPVWDFYGEYKPIYVDPNDPSNTDQELGYSYMTINAIDGSIINRSIGY